MVDLPSHFSMHKRQQICNTSATQLLAHRGADTQLSKEKLSLSRAINNLVRENQLLFDYIVRQKLIQVSSNWSNYFEKLMSLV